MDFRYYYYPLKKPNHLFSFPELFSFLTGQSSYVPGWMVGMFKTKQSKASLNYLDFFPGK